jgi:hypothetical protein
MLIHLHNIYIYIYIYTGAAVCVGLLLFALADAAVLPNFDPRGIILVVMSVCADAVLPNLQVC